MGNYLPVQAAHLLTLREKYGYTQEQVASTVGCTVKTYRAWEKGKTSPAVAELLKLSELYNNVSTDYLIGLIEEKNHDSKFVCEYTGLSEAAIDNIIKIKHSNSDGASIISDTISSKKFSKLIDVLSFAIIEALDIDEFYEYGLSRLQEILSDSNEDPIIDELPFRVRELKYSRYQVGEAAMDLLQDLQPVKDIISEVEEFLKTANLTPVP